MTSLLTMAVVKYYFKLNNSIIRIKNNFKNELLKQIEKERKSALFWVNEFESIFVTFDVRPSKVVSSFWTPNLNKLFDDFTVEVVAILTPPA